MEEALLAAEEIVALAEARAEVTACVALASELVRVASDASSAEAWRRADSYIEEYAGSVKYGVRDCRAENSDCNMDCSTVLVPTRLDASLKREVRSTL